MLYSKKAQVKRKTRKDKGDNWQSWRRSRDTQHTLGILYLGGEKVIKKTWSKLLIFLLVCQLLQVFLRVLSRVRLGNIISTVPLLGLHQGGKRPPGRGPGVNTGNALNQHIPGAWLMGNSDKKAEWRRRKRLGLVFKPLTFVSNSTSVHCTTPKPTSFSGPFPLLGGGARKAPSQRNGARKAPSPRKRPTWNEVAPKLTDSWKRLHQTRKLMDVKDNWQFYYKEYK